MTFTSAVNAADKHKKNMQTLKLVGEVYDSFTMGKVKAEMRHPVDVDIIHDGCREVTDYIMKISYSTCKYSNNKLTSIL